jgi:threonyl-tRNA synthetase
VQVVVMNVTDRQEAYVREVEAALRGRGCAPFGFAERENNV